DILWPPDGRDDQGINVDIVFIHGLGGKRHSTWSKDGVLWPRDLLAKDFPQARIMTLGITLQWGYDSRVMQFFGPVGQGSIHAHANELNNDLSQERSERHQIFRPLIFFAHSLGGLVVKSALFRSYLEFVSEAPTKDRSAAIERSTVAVVFAGTPHRGSDKAKWAGMATKLASLIQKDHSSQLSDALKRGSETLEVLQDWFKKIQDNFHVFTFVEGLPCPKIGNIVEPESAVINCQHEKRRMIHANHMEMVRFKHGNCNEYKKIKDAFTQIYQHGIGKRMQGAVGPSGRLDSSRGSYPAALEGSRPKGSNSTQELQQRPKLLAYQQQNISPGRVNTRTPEELIESFSRQSSNRLTSSDSLGQYSQRLHNRASTTTLDTTWSGASQKSDQSARSYECRWAGYADKNGYYFMEQGKRFAGQRDRNFAKNLTIAKQYFKKAHDLLSPGSDRADFASVQYQMMNVEFQMAFHRDMTPQEKLSHLQTAEQHGWDASNNARQSTNSGLLVQVQLYIAIIKGRRAEIHERLGVSAHEIRKQKDDALSEIFIACEKTRELNPSNLQESVAFAQSWTDRLKPPPQPAGPPETITTSIAELGASRVLASGGGKSGACTGGMDPNALPGDMTDGGEAPGGAPGPGGNWGRGPRPLGVCAVIGSESVTEGKSAGVVGESVEA
ncbi:MAG: hypothetical protein Q9163_005707, partial [Psora crenata]